jgi:hypothetical protein
MKREVAIVVGAALVLAGSLAGAGFKAAGSQVTITLAGANSSMLGHLGAVRNSDNAVEYISCRVIQYLPVGSNSATVLCSARNAAGTAVSCVDSGPGGWNPIAAMTANSRLDVDFNASTGACRGIRVSNFSSFPIIQP